MGDLMVLLAVLSLGAALLYPVARRRAFEQQVTTLLADVQGLRTDAERIRDQSGSWPESAPAGAQPPGAQPTPPYSMTRDAYTLQWSRWASVEIPQPDTAAIREPDDETNAPDPVPPTPMVLTRGGITVHTGDANLVGALFAQYGSAESFVRDTTWTLVLPRAATAELGTPLSPPPTLPNPFRQPD